MAVSIYPGKFLVAPIGCSADYSPVHFLFEQDARQHAEKKAAETGGTYVVFREMARVKRNPITVQWDDPHPAKVPVSSVGEPVDPSAPTMEEVMVGIRNVLDAPYEPLRFAEADPATYTTFDRVRRILLDHLSIREDEVRLDAKLTTDLGADSLDEVELVMALEEEFGFELPDDVTEPYHDATVSQVVEAVDKLLASLPVASGNGVKPDAE